MLFLGGLEAIMLLKNTLKNNDRQNTDNDLNAVLIILSIIILHKLYILCFVH